MSPRVSICLPVFNGERYLEAAIETVLAQTFGDFELIVVDDCSTDGTVGIVDEFQRLDPRVQLFRNDSNVGLFANYNRCHLRATGELIKPFAQDDLLHPEFLARSVAVFDNESEVVLTSVARGLVSQSGESLLAEIANAEQIVEPDKVVPGHEVIQSCLFPVVNFIGEPSTVMYRKRAVGEGFDSSFHHLGDIEYWLRILMEGDYYYISTEYCYFRWHDESSSARNARGLLIGPDLVRLARKFSWVIETCGRSESSFLQDSIIAFGGYVQALSEGGTLSTDYLREAVDLRSRVSPELMSNPEVVSLLDDLINFRELAFHTLRVVGGQAGSTDWTNKSDAAIGKNQDLINSLEEELRALLQSRSWVMTRMLRELSRVSSTSLSGVELEHYEVDSSADILEQQREYIGYLRTLITRVKLSRSWQLTKPFRAFDRRIQSSSEDL